jgi:vacuolar-type H+-ATPase subunit H
VVVFTHFISVFYCFIPLRWAIYYMMFHSEGAIWKVYYIWAIYQSYMAKKNAPQMTSEDILERIREAERSSKEHIERASAEAAQIVDEARRRSEQETQRSAIEVRSEIELIERESGEKAKAQVEAILRKRREDLSRQKDRATSNFPKARTVILERIAGMLDD